MQNWEWRTDAGDPAIHILNSAFCILHSAAARLCSRRLFPALIALFLLTGVAFADDRPAADGFLLALPDYQFEFPRDHGAHEAYRTEWWYYTGHLKTPAGRRYGFEVTFFRVGITPPPATPGSPWDLHGLGLAQFALTDISRKRFRYYEKMNRQSVFTAASRSGSLDVFNEGWRVSASTSGWHLVAAEGTDAIDLTMRSYKPPAIHGENGISVKAEGVGYASHYYSMSRLQVSGSIVVDGRRDDCRGLGWMDHEFGSSSLRETQQGWDWFSVQLDNDCELMLYRIRRRDGSADATSSGSVIRPDGSVIHIPYSDLRVESLGRWHSKKSGAIYPMGWRITIASLGISLELREELADQELITRASTMVTYWEGAVRATGRFAGNAVSGPGYVEMTGYDRAFTAP
jgi:predicted secreted hydrolase